MLKRYVFLVSVLITGSLCCAQNWGGLGLYKAIEQKDIKKFAQIIDANKDTPLFKDKQNVAPVFLDLFMNNSNESTKMLMILLENNAPLAQHIKDNVFAYQNKENVALLLPHFKKEELLSLKGKYLGDDTVYEFIQWLADADATKLSHDDIVRFTALALTMPAALDEFKTLLPLLKQADTKVFTPEVIKTALRTHNLEALKLLIQRFADNRTLIGIIRDQALNFTDKNFGQKVFEVIKAETGKPQLLKSGKGDVDFTFK